MIYLDYAATTPMSEQAAKVYADVATKYYGNASSLHDIGSNAKQIMEASQKVIAQAMNANPKDIYFTSGATESNFLSIQALVDGSKKEAKRIITSKTEHSSVLNVFSKLQSQGYTIDWVRVHENGLIDLDHLKELVTEETALVSIQHVNSELGVIQLISEIGAFLKQKNVLFHTDAVQSFGKIPTDVQALNVDALSVSAHKLYGPKGMGAVWIHPETEWKAYFEDENTRQKLKHGTDNVPGIAAFATAVKEIQPSIDSEYTRITALRNMFIQKLKELEFEVIIEGTPEFQLPHILGLRFPGMEGQFFMLECSQAGIGISTGSACQVGSELPNRTMTATGKNVQEAREFVRISFGKHVKEDHIKEIIPKIHTILKRHFDRVHRPLVNQ
ncbi:MAG: IscS subfamily cysteine desulfurase [Balneolales bacterium]|nr:IscS subfamily cysteine desulfurase [Balneolales bacterium]